MEAMALEPPGFDVGRWLLDHRRRFDSNEAAWLEVLAAWDRDGGWAVDGQLSGADWLRWRAKLSRSTAFEKLHVAHQLEGRPPVKQAFAAGEICYSAVRLITRLQGTTPAVDRALVALAAEGTVLQLEQAVRHYQLLADQDRPPDGRAGRDDYRGVHCSYGLNGTGRSVIDLTDLETKEFVNALQAFADPDPQAVNARADSGAPVPFWQRKADAFMDLVRTALAHAHDGHAMGADRYQLHIVQDVHTGQGRHLDGTPLNEATLAQLRCDTSTVSHLVDRGEPLAIGRKQRDWTTAQRRAILLRDHGRCRFPGCDRIYGDIHHIHWWDNGGRTDIDNGAYLCNRHHHLIHQKGFAVHGNANQTLTFTRPDNTIIATSPPPTTQLRLVE
jgi:hypothetical protein